MVQQFPTCCHHPYFSHPANRRLNGVALNINNFIVELGSPSTGLSRMAGSARLSCYGTFGIFLIVI